MKKLLDGSLSRQTSQKQILYKTKQGTWDDGT